jgi:hypothetical protein
MSKSAVPKIHVDLTADEIRAIVALTDDQLFRVKFIDPKMPGHRPNPDQVRAAESALHTLKAAVNINPPYRKPGRSDIVVKVKTTLS